MTGIGRRIGRTLVIVGIGAGVMWAGMAALQSPDLWELLIRRVGSRGDAFRITDVQIATAEVAANATLTLSGVDLEVVAAGRSYHVTVGDVVWGLGRGWRNGRVVMEGIGISGEDIHVHGGRGDFIYERGEDWSFQGPLFLTGLEIYDVPVRTGYFLLDHHQKQLWLDPAQVFFAEGRLQGKIVLDYREGFNYSMQLGLESVPVPVLSSAWPPLSDLFDGDLTGSLFLAGESYHLSQVRLEAALDGGGEIAVPLIRHLLTLLPEDMPLFTLASLPKDELFVYFETAEVELRLVNQQLLRSFVDFNSEDLILKARLSFDINLDAPLDEWLHSVINAQAKDEHEN